MAWEKRGRRRYYYRSVRHDDKVAKEYLGCGPRAVAEGERRESARQAEAIDRAAAEELAGDLEPLGRLMDLLDAGVGSLAEATLLLSGNYCHRGAWRRKHGQQRQSTSPP